jgi:hypothetical protein
MDDLLVLYQKMRVIIHILIIRVYKPDEIEWGNTTKTLGMKVFLWGNT